MTLIFFEEKKKNREREEKKKKKKSRNKRTKREDSPMACSTILKQDTQGSSPLPRREVTFRCRRNGSRGRGSLPSLSSQVMLLRVLKTPMFARHRRRWTCVRAIDFVSPSSFVFRDRFARLDAFPLTLSLSLFLFHIHYEEKTVLKRSIYEWKIVSGNNRFPGLR